MLSSRDGRFHWSKQDRAAAVPFFRMLARKWRPTVRRAEIRAEATSSKRTARPRNDAANRPVWTPWLWVE